jgi:hypothetical protein
MWVSVEGKSLLRIRVCLEWKISRSRSEIFYLHKTWTKRRKEKNLHFNSWTRQFTGGKTKRHETFSSRLKLTLPRCRLYNIVHTFIYIHGMKMAKAMKKGVKNWKVFIISFVSVWAKDEEKHSNVHLMLTSFNFIFVIQTQSFEETFRWQLISFLIKLFSFIR